MRNGYTSRHGGFSCGSQVRSLSRLFIACIASATSSSLRHRFLEFHFKRFFTPHHSPSPNATIMPLPGNNNYPPYQSHPFPSLPPSQPIKPSNHLQPPSPPLLLLFLFLISLKPTKTSPLQHLAELPPPTNPLILLHLVHRAAPAAYVLHPAPPGILGSAEGERSVAVSSSLASTCGSGAGSGCASAGGGDGL
jgi:hypothetical protein